MIYYDQEEKAFHVEGLVLLQRKDTPAINWKSNDPYIYMQNNTIIDTHCTHVSEAWYVTKYLIRFILSAWCNVIRSKQQ